MKYLRKYEDSAATFRSLAKIIPEYSIGDKVKFIGVHMDLKTGGIYTVSRINKIQYTSYYYTGVIESNVFLYSSKYVLATDQEIAINKYNL